MPTSYTRIELPSGIVLKADANGWTIAEKRTYATGARAGEDYDHDLKYPGPSLYAALSALQETTLRRSDATTLEGLMEAIRSFQNDLGTLLEVKATVRVGK